MTTSASSSFSIADFGGFSQLLQRPSDNLLPPGKHFLSGPLALTSCEISVNRLPEGTGYSFTHHHKRNEEIYLFLGGRGVFYADGVAHPVQEGTVLRVAPPVVRTLEADAGTPLDYVCIQAPAGGMPYTFRDDGVPDSTDVPSKKTFPLSPGLQAFFAQKR